MFFNELDVLDIRLHTLNDVVDKFVLIESPYTHRGNPKPLYFAENKDRFKPFLHKIVHLIFDEHVEIPTGLSTVESNWHVENAQRNALVRGLEDARPEDYIIISDCDEIPSPSAVLEARKKSGVTCCRLRMYYYFLNLRNYTRPYWTAGTRICSVKSFRSQDLFKSFKYSSVCPEIINEGNTLTKLRFLSPDYVIRDGGWHFSYIGGTDAIIRKCHSIVDGMENVPSKEEIEEKLRCGRDIIGNAKLFAEPLANDFPYWLTCNAELFRTLLFPISSKYMKKVRFVRTFEMIKVSLDSLARRLCPLWVKRIVWSLHIR